MPGWLGHLGLVLRRDEPLTKDTFRKPYPQERASFLEAESGRLKEEIMVYERDLSSIQ